VKPAAFAYHRPASLEEALALLAEHGGEAKALAGGQSLIPAMNFRLARPKVLVDLDRVAELRYLRAANGGLAIGAMTRHVELETSVLVARAAPPIAEAMPHVAHPQIRNRGTLGGSLAHADPAAELPAVMVALGATVTARSVRGARAIPAAEFFTGLFATALEPDELVVEASVPALAPRTGTAFLEMARRHGDYALAGVVAVVTLDEAARCRGARVILLSVGEGPVRAARAEAALVGQAPAAEAARAAAEAAATDDIDPPGDIHATADYRRQLVRVLTRRAVLVAAGRARDGKPA
jgi:CO/xanthine dehydrogenase FAD-binding subunit